jgi:serine/threonine protein kinase
MRGLNHPSIVRLLNFTESREHYYLTLECVPVFSLAVDESDADPPSLAG